MTIVVEKGDPHHPEATRLLKASHALMESLFPSEFNFYLSIDDLCAPDITFFVAKQGDTIVGCAAIANRGDYGELKSMYVDEKVRGTGAGQALINAIEVEAIAQSLSMIRLETGYLLKAAHRLYAKNGFVERGPFGDYPDISISLFMEKTLSKETR